MSLAGYSRPKQHKGQTMFSVYGVAGQLFRGSMEQLRQIKGVGAIARSNAIQALGRDGRDPAR